MRWQRWPAGPGRRRSSPHSCWPSWNGGAPTIILCDHTNHSEWLWCSRESEEANAWRNAIGSVRPPWPQGKPPDDGRHARCSRAPYRWLLLERLSSERWLLCPVASKPVMVPAEEVRWSLVSGRSDLSGRPNDEYPAR